MANGTRKIWHTTCCMCKVVECTHNANATVCVRGYHITDDAGTCLTCNRGRDAGHAVRPMLPAPRGIMAPLLMGHA